MKKNLLTNVLPFMILILMISNGVVMGQEFKDDPNLDQIPLWYIQQTQNAQRMPSEVITIDDFDNFYLGVDFAEGHITVNPLEPTQFFCAFNTDGAHYTNDGHNWLDSNPNWGTSMRGDPVTTYDGLGNLYYENMYGSSIQGCKVVKSADNGQTWGAAVNAISGNDKNWIAADQSTGPYANYVYSTMTNSGQGNFTRSIDLGQTWQSTFSPSTQSLPGMMVCVGPDGSTSGGSVYVVTNSGSSFASTYTFYESNDGGLSFTHKSAQQFSGYVGTDVNGRNSVQNMRTRPYPFITADNSNGPYRGRLHLVYATNDPPGNGMKPDIWSRYSDDGGTTWSEALRVNSGLNPQGSNQWQPATWCDNETGRLYVQWMDTRDTPTNDSALIYATYSDNGGQSFVANKKISNEKMKVNCSSCGGGGTPRYQGDYSGIVSNSVTSMVAWSDFRWGSFASFTAYFPDFAMRVYPTTLELELRDTIWAAIPAKKMYTEEAIFSASIEQPTSGSFTIEWPEGNIINSIFPDSIPLVITSNLVPVGNYTITIKGEGPNGTPVHYRDATIQVIPLSPPTAEFTAVETSTCIGNEIDFIDQSTNALSWLWTFDGGDPETSTDQFPTGIVWTEVGTYNVSLEVTNPAGTDLITKPDFISINEQPGAPEGENVSVCVYSEIPPLVATGTDIYWYSDPELTQIVFTGSPFYTNDTLPGTYTYYVTQNVSGCESEALMLTLSIYDTPAVTFLPFDPVCLSQEAFELENGEPTGGIYSGTGVEDGFFVPENAGVGTHTLEYAYADTNSCADTAYQDITVLPIDNVSLNSFASVCQDAEPFELSGGDPTGGTFSGNGVIDDMFYANEAGSGDHNINYTIISQNGCPSSATQILTVDALPDINLGNDTTICGATTLTLDATIPNAFSYLWSPGGQTTATITVDSSGIGYNSQEFGVLVTNENSCSNSDETNVTFINCTGIEDINGLVNVSLYPNPNDGTFNFNVVTNGSLTVNIKIFDAIGNKYYEKSQVEIMDKYSSKITLDNIAPGIYFIAIDNSEGTFVKKFFIR